MVTPRQALQKYGHPVHKAGTNCSILFIPTKITDKNPVIPSRIYSNNDIQTNLLMFFEALYERDLLNLIETWDGCYNVRLMRRSDQQWSLHSWALAFDINRKDNMLGRYPKMDRRLVNIAKYCGFDWGGQWRVPDGMHFQIKRI